MSDYAEIETLAEDYFRTLHEGDVESIKSMFLPTCELSCADENGLSAHMTLNQYLAAVTSRKTPKEEGYPCVGRIISIDQAGPNLALLKVDCAVQPRYFTDYLALIKEHGVWRIAAKVYFVRKVEN